MHSIEVWLNGELAAGEIGFAVGGAYTSLSGFSAVSSAGSVQLAAAAKLLERCGFSMWDLGMKMNYKTAIGATLIDRAAFLATLHAARDQVGVLLCAAHGGKAEAVTALRAREPSGGGAMVYDGTTTCSAACAADSPRAHSTGTRCRRLYSSDRSCTAREHTSTLARTRAHARAYIHARTHARTFARIQEARTHALARPWRRMAMRSLIRTALSLQCVSACAVRRWLLSAVMIRRLSAWMRAKRERQEPTSNAQSAPAVHRLAADEQPWADGADAYGGPAPCV